MYFSFTSKTKSASKSFREDLVQLGWADVSNFKKDEAKPGQKGLKIASERGLRLLA